MNNKYDPYSDSDLYLLLNEPREVSDRPYMLHAAFLLSCLFESLGPEDDYDADTWNQNEMWGQAIPQKVLDSIVKNANEQFVEASKNGLQIDIWGRPFSIRKVNAYDPNRLHQIFNFKTEGDCCTISKTGVMNLQGYSKIQAEQNTREEYPDNKAYLRKVIMTAEDDENDGWDKLTDIEVTMYLWAIFYRKYEFENEVQFRSLYKEDLYTTESDDRKCWTEHAVLRGKPFGLYTFSAKKVRSWNEEQGQQSIIDSISEEAADDYWYNVATKTTCK